MTVKAERNGAVLTITLDRPDKLNAIDEPMKARLTDLFAEARSDAQVRAVVVAATGRAFCSGGDVGTMGSFTAASIEKRLGASHRMLQALDAVDKPVIASVRGAAAGIGWSLALACDQIIASDTALFSQSFKNVGAVPDGAALFFLMRNIGLLKTKELVLSGRRVRADEALSLGLVNRVVADASLEQETSSLAHELAAGPTLAYGLGKRLLKQLEPCALDAFMSCEMWAQTIAVLSEDHNEGVQAFLARRAPRFSGR